MSCRVSLGPQYRVQRLGCAHDHSATWREQRRAEPGRRRLRTELEGPWRPLGCPGPGPHTAPFPQMRPADPGVTAPGLEGCPGAPLEEVSRAGHQVARRSPGRVEGVSQAFASRHLAVPSSDVGGCAHPAPWLQSLGGCPFQAGTTPWRPGGLRALWLAGTGACGCSPPLFSVFIFHDPTAELGFLPSEPSLSVRGYLTAGS